ncbi:aspartate aminotransferase family protein [Desertibaculum subflavum]|uniref:aspartate aminotransferase family protein n=1 Tax=Desertibaculum subflavum TaxID=2268458 RepID=UPI000E661D01
MNDTLLANSAVIADFRRRTPGSARLHEEASRSLPSGIAHDSRHLSPYPIYVERAEGPRKWDVDGNEYVDYFGGHGALLLGHSHPAIVAAVQRQMAAGTHYGSCHALEVRWAALIKQLMPAMENVRFTSSGTEASQLALRLARAHTGKPKVIRYIGHFHGWHDHVAAGANSHFDGSAPVGTLAASSENMLFLSADSLAPTLAALDSGDDIAAVILEPSGASWGQVPLPPGFLEGLREATAAKGVVLIFDEVVTGFRLSPGGAQAKHGIVPDLTVLGKIVAGGLPGGAVAGRRAILEQLDFAAMKAQGREKVAHQGTFNANPLAAAAAVAMLEQVATGEPNARADRAGERLRAGMNRVLRDERAAWAVYGEASQFHIFTNPRRIALDPLGFDPVALGFAGLKGAKDPGTANRLRLAMLNHGVDIMGAPGGLISAAHDDAAIDATIEGFARAVRMLKAEGDIP